MDIPRENTGINLHVTRYPILNSKKILDTNVIHKMRKHLEESIRENLCNFGAGRFYPRWNTESMKHKRKISKLDLLKIGNIFVLKDTTKKIKIR